MSLALLAFVAVGCASTDTPIEAAGEIVEDEATAEPEAVAPETALLSGREAILANQAEGKPYVLWYWGAH